jgi:hypothetical protein
VHTVNGLCAPLSVSVLAFARHYFFAVGFPTSR